MEGNLVRLTVEVDEPEFDQALGDVVRALAKQVRVPGFRPGKVPRKVLEARMGGAGALRAEATGHDVSIQSKGRRVEHNEPMTLAGFAPTA